METIAERFDRLAGAFAAKIDAVPEDKWAAQSPCEEWTALDVVRHVSETPGMFYGFIGKEAEPLPPVEDDPAAAFAAMRRQMQATLDDPGLATTTFDGFFGRSTFEKAVDRFLNFDLLIHGWDLARATGLDEHMDPEDVKRLDQAAAQFGDAARAPGVFGPEIEVPADADPQTKVLGFVGRRA